MMCVRIAQEDAVGPALQPKVGVAVCPRGFSSGCCGDLLGAGGRGDFPGGAQAVWKQPTRYRAVLILEVNMGCVTSPAGSGLRISNLFHRNHGAGTEHSVSICLCLSTDLLQGVGDWWPGARPGLPEELRSFLIPLPTSRLRRELPPLSHDSFVTRPKRRHLSGCSLLSCDGRDSVSALWQGRSWAFCGLPMHGLVILGNRQQHNCAGDRHCSVCMQRFQD